MGIETIFSHQLARCAPCDVASAATAIVETARSRGGGVTILALGALTNLAEAIRRYPADFRRLCSRIIFIGDTDRSRPSYNIALDPAALRVVLASGIELVLVGSSCCPPPSWVEALFAEGGMGVARSAGSDDASLPASGARSQSNAPAAQWEATLAPGPATALRALGSLDPYSMCYDPLALLYHLQPDAFAFEQTATPVSVRVGGDTSTASGWSFERCDSSGRRPEAHDGYVIEPSGMSLQCYAHFLRQASSTGRGGRLN